MMPVQSRNLITTVLGPDLDALVWQKAGKQGKTLSKVARGLFARWVDRLKLANAAPMGRKAK